VLSFQPLPTYAAKGRLFELQDGKFRLDLPAQWEDEKNFLGVPLIVLGPRDRDSSRPVVTVVPTGIDASGFEDDSIKKEVRDYRKGREQYVKKHSGVILAFEPYRTESMADGVQGRSIGVRYKADGKTFIEKSYFLICKKKLYFLKSILGSRQEKT